VRNVGVVSQLVKGMRRWGPVILVMGMAACSGSATPVDPIAIDTELPAPPPVEEPTSTPNVEPTAQPDVDLDEGWTVVDDVAWPVEPGCCGMADVGPTSPEGPIPQDGWPTDGFYEVEVSRTADDLTVLHLRMRRWVRCTDLPDDPCAPDSQPDPDTGEDLRIVGDPASEVVRDISADDVRVVLVPIHDFSREEPRALDGEPGAFARLLAHGIDPAYHEWVIVPVAEGREHLAVWEALLERSDEPDFPFGMDYWPDEQYGPMAYRGPFGTWLLSEPPLMAGVAPSWPPGHNGMYGWRAVTLEVRDGLPVLYLWAGQVAG
jgi:hypothetical protein